ncbi:PREDICTED: probable G-protein coupled receptor No18 [Branchiostoma belcheri]|uniref:Probable G-protein coupled receptor No18 n=1 Tax=Branchiostoma belcheri TaxID=7741 RepID=A0A6P5AQW5_BRABE|nr:PREDICTED: probable G-protein coupled receptor No18 [Branchiostoma belcheri]
MATNGTNDSLGLTNSTAFDWEPFYYADPPYRELQMVWLTACTVLGVCGNMALLITVSCVQELRTPGNALLCALAAADVLQLLAKVPPSMIFLFNGKALPCDGVFVILDTVYFTMAQFSVNIIAPISIDRYWYICHPLKYSETMTLPRIALLIGLSFLFAIVTMVHPLLEGLNNYFNPPYMVCKYLGPARKSRQAMVNVFLLLPMITMMFCYYRIWRELKRRQNRHNNKICPETRSEMEYSETVVPTRPRRAPATDTRRISFLSDGDDTDDAPAFSPDDDTPSSASQADAVTTKICLAEGRDKQDQSFPESSGQFKPPRTSWPWDGVQISPEFRARMRSATLVLLIVVAYVVSWAPYFGVLIRSNALGDEASAVTDGRWTRFAVLFSLLSTFSNPIIYAYRNPQLREGFFGLVRRGSL